MLELVSSQLIARLQRARMQRTRDERGLSQSTENAILLAGAAAIAIIVISVITAYVRTRLNNMPG